MEGVKGLVSYKPILGLYVSCLFCSFLTGVFLDKSMNHAILIMLAVGGVGIPIVGIVQAVQSQIGSRKLSVGETVTFLILPLFLYIGGLILTIGL